MNIYSSVLKSLFLFTISHFYLFQSLYIGVISSNILYLFLNIYLAWINLIKFLCFISSGMKYYFWFNFLFDFVHSQRYSVIISDSFLYSENQSRCQNFKAVLQSYMPTLVTLSGPWFLSPVLDREDTQSVTHVGSIRAYDNLHGIIWGRSLQPQPMDQYQSDVI